MRYVGHYADKAVPSFPALVAVSTENRKAALEPLANVIASACAKYDAAAPNVHGLKPIKIDHKLAQALKEAYDHRTVAMKRYLATMLESLPQANADLCPYCSLDTNPDLDHFLPKEFFPEFSLYARNLLPICTTCNRKKGATYKTSPGGERQFLNPSAEPSSNTCVLQAELRFRGNGIVVTYGIDDGGKLSKAERALVCRHYERLGLGVRYSRRAHSHLASFKASVSSESQAVVAKTLQEKINSSQVGEPTNSWQPALYRSIAQQKAQTVAWLKA